MVQYSIPWRSCCKIATGIHAFRKQGMNKKKVFSRNHQYDPTGTGLLEREILFYYLHPSYQSKREKLPTG